MRDSKRRYSNDQPTPSPSSTSTTAPAPPTDSPFLPASFRSRSRSRRMGSTCLILRPRLLPLFLLLLLSQVICSPLSVDQREEGEFPAAFLGGEVDPSEYGSTYVPMDLVRFLRSVERLNEVQQRTGWNTDDTYLKPSDVKKRELRKRGFGIAGLDNVDMITSTLDRSRSRSRSRSRYRPHQMSLNVNLSQLRALMAKAG